MIHHLTGTLTEVNPTQAVVECQGVGYLVNISLQTYTAIASKKELTLFILPIYKEDSQSLFGFHKKEERALFSLLISVSGVGGNTARVILSSLSSSELTQGIAGENVKLLQSVKGIGAKTAQRIIIDLKDKVSGIESTSTTSGMPASNASEASAALEVLGYTPKQTERILLSLLKEDGQMMVEDLIKGALKRL
jgi:Holliday junction DNA helicase RuvA